MAEPESRPLHRGAPSSASTCTAASPSCRSSARTGTSTCGSSPIPRRGSTRPAGSSSRPITTSCGCSTRRACRSSAPGSVARRRRADVDDRAVWQLLADNVHLFALTPTGLWLRETLATVFGIEERLDSASAEAIYARVEEQLATPAFAPRALLDRFRVECLSTTDAAGSSLAEHRALAESEPGSASGRPFVPTRSWRSTPPAGATRCPSSRPPPTARSATTRRSSTALAERRAAFKALGATATDHAATSADTTRLADREASALFAAALAGTVSHADARRFEAHMLNEFARMSSDDGLVMQLHVGSLRDHNRPLAERFGRDIGADIPVATDWTRGLRPLLEAYGNDPALRRHSLHARREHVQPRARAARRPLSRGLARLPVVVPRQPGGHRPFPRPGHRDGRAVQPRRLRRRRPRPDRASCAARSLAPPHVRLARAGRSTPASSSEEEARRLAWELAYGLVRRAYRLD